MSDGGVTVEVTSGAVAEVEARLGPSAAVEVVGGANTATIEVVGGTPGPPGQGVPPGGDVGEVLTKIGPGDFETEWMPSGQSGGGFIFQQGVAATVWTIVHDLAFVPNVTTVDSTGRQVEGDVVYQSGQIVITFSSAFAGTAYLS